jgi:outer membrane protein, heavy metal efflux system
MSASSVPFAALFSLVWALCPATLHAQVSLPDALTLEGAVQSAVQTALQHSPALQAAKQDLLASEGAVLQAGARPNPELQALQEDARGETRATTWQLSQPFELGGQRAARVSAARLAQAQTAVALQARRAQVRADATEAFFDLALAQERVHLAQASSQLGAQALQAASRRVLAGKVSPVEETRARLEQALVAMALVQAQSEQRVAQQRLGSLLGVPASQVPVLNWQGAASAAAVAARSAAWIRQAESRLAEAPALRLQQLEVERRQALSELESARRIPDVTVTLGAKRAQEMRRQQALLGVSLALPLWDRNEGQVLQALRLQDKAAADLAETQRAVSLQWLELKEQLLSAQAETQALERDILPGAQQAWQAAVTGFEAGKFSFLETLDAQRTWFQARAQHLRALGAMHRTAADIDRLLGTQEATP